MYVNYTTIKLLLKGLGWLRPSLICPASTFPTLLKATIHQSKTLRVGVEGVRRTQE